MGIWSCGGLIWTELELGTKFNKFISTERENAGIPLLVNYDGYILCLFC